MAKKKSTSKKSLQPKKVKAAGAQEQAPQGPAGAPNLPPEVQKKLEAIKKQSDKFKDQVLDKFGDYIVGITLLPPEQQKDEKDKKKAEEKLDLMVVVDDSDSKKMGKEELLKKFSAVIKEIAEKIDKKLNPQCFLQSEIWQSSFDAKYDLNRMVAMSTIIHDTGLLAGIKISEIHKSMVIKKFEKYIVSYVLAGSLTQGRATEKSDIDVWIVIDDTDVKKMSRAELKDKLRAIIIGMGMEAGEMTGIKNKLNIQVYILTDFWDSLKEANPIIFTLLRDGVPFFDRGIFMPWKQLLRMGKIKPSREAIDMFMSSGTQMIKRVGLKLREIGMEDLYYATLTPSQAALMLWGIPPPTPRETAEVMEEILVKKEKLLEKKWVDILKKNVQVRKDLEHGDMKEISGAQLDKMIKDSNDFLKRIEKLFEEIQARHDQKTVLHLYEEVITIIRDVLKLEGIEKTKDNEIVKIFENELISSGKVPVKWLRELEEVVEAKAKYDKGKLNKSEIEKARKGSIGLIRFLVEYMQRKRGKELEKAKIRVKYGERFGEIILLEQEAFIIMDIDAKEEPVIERAKIKKDGSLDTAEKSSLQEFEKALANATFPKRVFIKEPIFEDIKRFFGKEAEVLLHYF